MNSSSRVLRFQDDSNKYIAFVWAHLLDVHHQNFLERHGKRNNPVFASFARVNANLAALKVQIRKFYFHQFADSHSRIEQSFGDEQYQNFMAMLVPFKQVLRGKKRKKVAKFQLPKSPSELLSSPLMK